MEYMVHVYNKDKSVEFLALKVEADCPENAWDAAFWLAVELGLDPDEIRVGVDF